MDNWRAWLEDYTLADVAGLDNAEGLIDDLRDLGEDGSDGELGMDSTLAEILDYDVIQTRRQTLRDQGHRLIFNTGQTAGRFSQAAMRFDTHLNRP